MPAEPESYPSGDGLAKERNWWKWALVEVEASRWYRRRRERKERIYRREPDTVAAEAGVGLVKRKKNGREVWQSGESEHNKKRGCIQREWVGWGSPLKFKRQLSDKMVKVVSRHLPNF